MRGEFCEAKGENGETCIFGRKHTNGYHLTPEGGRGRWWTPPTTETPPIPSDALEVFARLTAAVTDAYVCPAEDMDPRERWSKLGLAHQRAEAYLSVLGVEVPDCASRIAAAKS